MTSRQVDKAHSMSYRSRNLYNIKTFMQRYFIYLSYDGTSYHGWQVQKRDVSVCSATQDALEKICGHPVKLTGCGRTDAGVHALRYCANFRTDCRIPIDRFALAANSRLPDDIAVVDAVEVDERFNSISSCIKKEYIYKIHNSNIRDPFLEKRACFYPQELHGEKRGRPDNGRGVRKRIFV